MLKWDMWKPMCNHAMISPWRLYANTPMVVCIGNMRVTAPRWGWYGDLWCRLKEVLVSLILTVWHYNYQVLTHFSFNCNTWLCMQGSAFTWQHGIPYTWQRMHVMNIFQTYLRIDLLSTPCEIDPGWVLQNLTDDRSTLTYGLIPAGSRPLTGTNVD